MTALSVWLASCLALACGFYAMAVASHHPTRWKIAPSMFVGACAMIVGDRGLAVFGVALTAEQWALKPYLPAFVIFWAAVTIVSMSRLADRK